jgi:hypothetical protein
VCVFFLPQILGTDAVSRAATCDAFVTPAACALSERLAVIATQHKLRILRIGYRFLTHLPCTRSHHKRLWLPAAHSVVEAGVWIRPHCGASNAQLKLHLGLDVPEGACATFRVGNTTQPWVQQNKTKEKIKIKIKIKIRIKIKTK